MARREMRGKVKQVTGRAREAAGILTGNQALEKEGARERAAGALDETVAKTRRKVGAVVAGIAKAIDR